MEATKDHEQAESQAKAQLGHIIDLVEWLEHVNECTEPDCKEGRSGGDFWEDSEEYHDQDKPQQIIQEHPLSVQVRSDWENLGEDLKATEFNILLCTGGPAVRIVGDLDEHAQPDSARIEYQDWFTSWEAINLTDDQEEQVLTYCRQFYFGEG